jgi:hypothetical protein
MLRLYEFNFDSNVLYMHVYLTINSDLITPYTTAAYDWRTYEMISSRQ